MGYSIPGADYTSSPQLQTNVGAEVGKMVGGVLASLGPAFIAQQKETAKLTQIKSDYETTTMVANQGVVDQLLAKGEGEIKDESVYEQWSKQVIARGKAATQAQIDIRFGDLSGDEKDKQLGIISSFNNYNNKSLETLGRYTADIKLFQDPASKANTVVIGDLTNGENLLNTITIDASSGKPITDIYGPKATSSRKLNVDGDNNELHSIVTIPKNGEFITKMKNKNSAFNDILAKGIAEKNIREDENGNYIFERKINLNAYGGDSGFDFVVPLNPRIAQDKLLQDSGFVSAEGGFEPNAFHRVNTGGTLDDPTDDKPISTFQTTESLENNKVAVSSYEILDMSQLNNNETFTKMLGIESKTILKDNNQVIAANLANNYGVSSVENWNGKKYTSMQNFLENASDEDKQSFIGTSIKQDVYSKMFQGMKSDVKKGVGLVRKVVDKDFKEYLNNNNIMNENGQEYKLGQEVFTRETRSVDTVSKPGGDTINVYQNTLDLLNAPNAKPQDILASPISVPGGNKIGWNPEGDGQYVIYKSDGTPTDTTLTLPQVKLQLQRGI